MVGIESSRGSAAYAGKPAFVTGDAPGIGRAIGSELSPGVVDLMGRVMARRLPRSEASSGADA
jgi:NAD(P)-dependent dehydrogenase (short-subunit alcohol dehydrogenase family)